MTSRREGREDAAVISDREHEGIQSKSRQPKGIVQFFRESPLVGLDLDLKRDKDTGRDVTFASADGSECDLS